MLHLSDFHYYMPTRVEFGVGLSEKTGAFLVELKAKKVFVVTDKGVRVAGLLTGIEQSLKAAELPFQIYEDVEPNPSAETIHKALDVLSSFGANTVLAVGGGSSIDTGKAVAAMSTNPGNIMDYEGVGKLLNKPLTLVAIPTTAGTGSEATSSTVITNPTTQFKAGIISPMLYPKLAILDPGLTLRLPQEITASTGMDALTHAIESYTSKAANPLSEALALQAIRMIGSSIKTAYFVGSMESREQMLVASLIAGMAFSQSRLGNVHAIAHTLGGVFNIPHGIANAVLLPFVMQFNLPACPERMKIIAEALGRDVSGLSLEKAGEQAIEGVLELNRTMNIPGNIKELGVTVDYFPKLVEDSMRSGNVLINPRLTKASDIRRIIENAYHGIL